MKLKVGDMVYIKALSKYTYGSNSDMERIARERQKVAVLGVYSDHCIINGNAGDWTLNYNEIEIDLSCIICGTQNNLYKFGEVLICESCVP